MAARPLLQRLCDLLARTRIYAYFAATAAVGVMTIIGDPAGVCVCAVGSPLAALLFGGWYVALGVLGIYARAIRSLRGESMVVILLGGFAVVHGVVLIADGAIASGVRIAAAMLMMTDWAAMRRGLTVTNREARELAPS